MFENYELVQKGLDTLHPALAGFVGQQMSKAYKGKWWDEVLNALSDWWYPPLDGTYEELVDSLDLPNCLKLIARRWNDVFQHSLSRLCLGWAKQLLTVRNSVAHKTATDMDCRLAEHALDTMALFCREIDEETEAELEKLLDTLRGDGAKGNTAGTAEKSDSKDSGLVQGRPGEGPGLLKLAGTELVKKTASTRKITYGGKTEIYPVYRVSLDLLYYNDQNDRIATWISQYESETVEGALEDISRDFYNQAIEDMIVASNPEAIQTTQNNIAMVGQREAGVTLADGRVVDGNRRLTCLRRLQREDEGPLFFETVILDMDAKDDRKQIKLLELAIQHGEEKKVDYDLIDYAVGTYRDIVQTQLLTVEEYALNANEKPSEVRKRIEIAAVICEFLRYLGIPEQYHVAREYQVYNLFLEMMAPLKKLDADEQQQLKTIAFNNEMMKAVPDQRQFIRDIKKLIKDGAYTEYFGDQERIGGVLRARMDAAEIRGKDELARFVEDNGDIADALRDSLDRAMLRYRIEVLKSRPAENAAKCVELLMDVDPRLFGKMSGEEKEEFEAQLDELDRIVKGFRARLSR